jgi:hypothetical protein
MRKATTRRRVTDQVVHETRAGVQEAPATEGGFIATSFVRSGSRSLRASEATALGMTVSYEDALSFESVYEDAFSRFNASTPLVFSGLSAIDFS